LIVTYRVILALGILKIKKIKMDLFAPSHLIIIILMIVLLFGGKKIPELMKGLGHGVKEFKNAMKDDEKVEPESKKLIEKE
jgi:sec-independent protein translocase protein TatA